MKEVEERKGRLNIDTLMIAGKYFVHEYDYVNAMKVCKKFNELVPMYRYSTR